MIIVGIMERYYFVKELAEKGSEVWRSKQRNRLESLPVLSLRAVVQNDLGILVKTVLLVIVKQ